MKNQRLMIGAGAMLLALAAFWLIDFRLAFTNTINQKLIITTDTGQNMPDAMQQKEKISLVLEGEGPLAGALRKALTREIDKAGLGQVELAQGREQDYPNPVLIVKLLQPGPIWTPFFAMSGFSVHAGYISNGDTSFFEPVERTHTGIGRAGIATMYAEYDLTDRSMGLISRPGYYHYLADVLAQEIITVLKGMYHV